MAKGEQVAGETRKKGQASFCVPRAAIEALLRANATAYEICAYLILARFTDPSGVYSTASLSAVRRYTGANMSKGGPIDRAIERLKTIRASRTVQVSNGRSGKSHGLVNKTTDLGPILYDRAGWLETTGELLEDGPTPRGAVAFILPDLGELPEDRVWFGGGLIDGFEGFKLPLKSIRHGGDVAARLLLTMYAVNDMETWGGVNPHKGPWQRYEPVAEDNSLRGGARLIRAKRQGTVAQIERQVSDEANAYWRALELLESSGLFYEVVLVLNRNAKPSKFASGGDYGAIPHDAEPLYELDARSLHGFKPEGEEGLGGVTASTAGDVGASVTVSGGQFDGTYAAIVRRGQGAMITGIYRPRFRVANPKNAWVKSAWQRIHDGNREALEFIQAIRAANGLEPARAPWDVAMEAKEAKGQASAPPAAPDATLDLSDDSDDFENMFASIFTSKPR